MRSRFRPLVSLVLSAALLLGCVGCGGSAKAPTTITVWNYYSGDLLSSFNALVNQFNATVGKEKNIVVESFNQGSVTDLEANGLLPGAGWARRPCPTSTPAMPTWPMTSTCWARS